MQVHFAFPQSLLRTAWPQYFLKSTLAPEELAVKCPHLHAQAAAAHAHPPGTTQLHT